METERVGNRYDGNMDPSSFPIGWDAPKWNAPDIGQALPRIAPRISIAMTLKKRLSGKQGPRTLRTLALPDECTKHVLSYLDKYEPKAHRAVARSFVGERHRRSFVLFKEPLKMMMAAQSMESVTYPLERLSRIGALSNISSSYSPLVNVWQCLTASVQEEEYDEVETHQCEMCHVCGGECRQVGRDGEDVMVVAKVAVADLHMFLNIHFLPLQAKPLCLKYRKYLEKNICVGNDRDRRTCYNRFLLEDDMMDMRDAPFWHEDCCRRKRRKCAVHFK